MSYKFATGSCRLSYAHLFAPHPDLSGNLKYSASLIIPKNDEQTIKRYKEVINRMMKDPEIQKTLGKGGSPRMPLVDGDENRPEDSAYKNSYYINAKSNPDHAPKVFDRDRQPIVDKDEVYSGCYVQAVLNFYAYNKGGNKGIGCSLGGIRKLKDGPALSGAAVSDNDFDDSLIGDSVDDFF